jgi:hypothetical protein
VPRGRAGEVVAKQELLDEVWGGRIVGEDALIGAVSQVRKALGDDARSPRFVETLPKRGYRLRVAPVQNGPAAPEAPGDAGRRRGWRWAGYVFTAAVLLGRCRSLPLRRSPAHRK